MAGIQLPAWSARSDCLRRALVVWLYGLHHGITQQALPFASRLPILLRASHNPPEDTVSDPALFVSLLTIELVIPWAQSLKDRRSAVRGLKDRLRSRFNASVAEIAFHDKWQRATIAVCIIDGDRRQLESAMTRVRRLTEEAQDLVIADMQQQWL